MKIKNLKLIIRVYRWCTKTRLRKFLSTTLAILIVLTSIRYLFLSPKEALASDIYLAMDEGYGTSSAVRDSNSTVSAGSITNAVWRAEEFCKSGKCLYFDGTGDYVSFTDDTNLDFTATNTFTIEGWFRTPDITSGQRTLIAKANGTSGGYKVYMDSSGYLIFGIDDDTTWAAKDTASTSTTAFDDNKWHFFSAVKNGTTSISIYVDGVLYQTDSSLSASGSLANAATFYVGIDGDGTSNGYSGFLDEVKILRTARTQAQIITDYLSGNTSITGAGPVGWWRMDEASWTNDCATDTVRDSSGNGLDGDACPASTGPTGGASGKYGNAGSFDGSNDYVTIADNDAIDFNFNQDFTVSVWIKPDPVQSDTTDDTNIILEKWAGSGAYPYVMRWLNQTGTPPTYHVVVARYDGTNVPFTASTTVWNDNNWHHISFIKSGSSLKLYADGVLEGSTTDTTTTTTTNAVALNIGRRGNNTRFFKGGIDDVRIYNYARSQSQVFEDMAGYPPSGTSASFGPDTSYLSNGLVGYWKLDDNTGTTTVDSSGIANTGTFYENTTANASGPTWTTGKYGPGANFPGSDDIIRIPDSNNYAFGSNLSSTTVSAWFKTSTNFTSLAAILAKFGPTTTTFPVALYLNTSEFACTSINNSGGQIDACGTTTLNDGNWHMITGTRDGTKKEIYLYVDGQFITKTTYTSTASYGNTDNLSIGNAGTSNYNLYDFTGVIDEVRAYNRALSPAEVAKLYSFAPGPDAYWKMEEESNTSRNDSSSNGSTLSESASDDIDKAIGKFGSAADIELGDTEYLEVADNQYVSAGNIDMTITAWVKAESFDPNTNFVFYKGASSNSTWEYHLRADGASDWRFGWNPGGGVGSTEIANTTTSTTGVWYFIAAYHKASNGEVGLSINNGPFTTGTVSGGNDSTASLKIGANQLTSENWDGLIDEVKIYKYIRTGAQLLEDMNGGHPAPGSPVGSATGYWKFDEGALNTCSGGTNDYCDSSPNANNLAFSTTTGGYNNDGKFGKAFNGTGSVWIAQSADDSDFDFAAADDFSLAFWFRSDSGTNPVTETQYLIGKGTITNTGTAGYTVYANTSGNIVFGIRDDATWGASSPTTPTPEDSVTSSSDIYDGTWHHIVATKTGTSRIDLYVDGKPNGTADTSLAASGTLANSIVLRLADDDSDATNSFAGDLDDVKIYRSVLTSDQVKVEYNRGFGQSMGALSTNSTGAATNSDLDAYCPPGQGSACTAPIAEFKFDENTGTSSVNDTSTSGYTGTMNGTMTQSDWVPGKFGSALDFDGTDDYISCTDANCGGTTNLDMGTRDWSVSAWIKTNSTSGSFLVTKGGFACGGSPDVWTLEMNGTGTLRAAIHESGQTCQFTAGDGETINDNNWHHIAATWDRDGFLTRYIDGRVSGAALDISSLNGFTIDNTNAFNIARRDEGADPGYLTGRLDHIRIYNYVRTPAQISWDYNRGGPVGWWKMDENTGTTANDSSGNNNSGTLTNTPTWTTGKFNSAVNFAGSNQHITRADDADFDFIASTPFSVSAWFKHSAASATETILSKLESTGTDGGYKLKMESDGDITCETDDDDADTTIDDTATTTAATYDDGSWHHVACVYDTTNTDLLIYIDGILAASDTTTTTNSLANDDALFIGIESATGTEDWVGDLDDVRIYRYPLTLQQIKTVMNNSAATRFAPITGVP